MANVFTKIIETAQIAAMQSAIHDKNAEIQLAIEADPIRPVVMQLATDASVSFDDICEMIDPETVLFRAASNVGSFAGMTTEQRILVRQNLHKLLDQVIAFNLFENGAADMSDDAYYAIMSD